MVLLGEHPIGGGYCSFNWFYINFLSTLGHFNCYQVTVTLFKISEKFLISLLSEFDINFKNFRICVKNQIIRNYGHFYWIICSIVLSFHLLETFNLLLISDDDEENLKIAGSIDFYVGSKGTRFMLDLCTITHYSLNLILLSNYFSD